ncbi:amidase [Streptomyces thinghirensis]|uniref:Amidase family protein n=1 Tax=Streptomyces thinghirensis TaxID=551547 RepID=A0ABP9T5N0_9ACTN
MQQGHPWQRSATELARSIRSGEVSSREVVQAHLDRMDAVNGSINAVTARFDEEALRCADAADAAVQRGDVLGPLHGVPITVKVNLDVVGQASDGGLPAMAEQMADEDCAVVRNLREAGAIVIARTNMPDLGMRWNTDNALHGPTRNPWDPRRTPGGSSGGCAAAVAAGMSCLSIGNDYGGSIRLPAAYNGVASLRPTPGRLPSPVDPEDADGLTVQLFYTDGPLARSVADLELALSVMRRPDPGDPFWVDASLGESGPCKVLVARGWLGLDLHPEVAAGLDAAAQHLEAAGYELVEAELPMLEEAVELWRDLGATEIDLFVPEDWMALGTEASRRWCQTSVSTSQVLDAAGYADAFARRAAVAAAWSRQFAKTPLILAPVDTQLAFMTEFDAEGDIEAALAELRPRYAMNLAGSLLGLPTVTVPVSVGASGMPQSVQLASWRYQEQRVLTAGSAIEAKVAPITPLDLVAQPGATDR